MMEVIDGRGSLSRRGEEFLGLRQTDFDAQTYPIVAGCLCLQRTTDMGVQAVNGDYDEDSAAPYS